MSLYLRTIGSLILIAASSNGVMATLTVLSTAAYAQHLSEAVMRLFVAGKFDDAIVDLKPVWVLSPGEIDQKMPNCRTARDKMQTSFGNSLGFRIIGEDKVSDFLVRFDYAELRELNVIRWPFT